MRKLLTRADIIIVLLCISLAILLYFFLFGEKGNKAKVIYMGETVEIIDLTDDSFYEMHINGVHIVRENGEIYVKESTCPDKLCVRAGHLTKTGQSAVCVPNKVSVTIEGKTDGPQAVSG